MNCSNSFNTRIIDTDIAYTGESFTCGDVTVNTGDSLRKAMEVLLTCQQDVVVAVSGNTLPVDVEGKKVAFVGSGTYTQAGGPDIVVPDGSMGILFWDGSEWSLSQSVELPALPNEIVDVNVILDDDKVFYDYEEARGSVPQEYRKTGAIIIYNTPSGRAFEKLVTPNWSISDSSWKRIDIYSENRFAEPLDNLYFHVSGELRRDVSNIIRSRFFRLTTDITFYNYSVLSSNSVDGGFASFFIFDSGFNQIGYLVDSTASTYNKEKKVIRSEVISEFPNAVYIATNTPLGAGFNSDMRPASIVSKEIADYHISGDNFKNSGFIHKTSGLISQSSDYYSSDFIEYHGGDITVTGWSGADQNNAALIAMYDKNGNYLGHHNTSTFGLVYDVVIQEGDIIDGTKYIRSSRGKNQSNGYVFSIGAKPSRLFDIPNSGGGGDRSYDNIFELADPKKTIDFNNYLGNSENIHPKVLYFRDGWKGYKFWMAYTPYPGGSTLYENPAIAVSNDGLKWTLPSGAPNPLDPKPEYGYNSDTHLVYRDDLDVLEVFYRPFNTSLAKNEIKRIVYDGSTWSSPELIIDTDGEQMLSPAILWEDGIYKWYYCRGNFVYYAESEPNSVGDLQNITALDIEWGIVRPWHIDVIRTDKGVEMAVQGFRPSLGEGNNSSDLYYVCEFNDGSFSDVRKIIPRGETNKDIDYTGVYRASILYINQIYYIYYTFLDASSRRGLALKFGRDIDNLRAI